MTMDSFSSPKLNRKLLEYLTSTKGRTAVSLILDGDENAINTVAQAYFDTYGLSKDQQRKAREAVIQAAHLANRDAAGFDTKAAKDNKSARPGIGTEKGKQMYNNNMQAIKSLLMRDPKLALVLAASKAVSSGARAVGQITRNDANKLAEAILTASRSGITDRGRELFGQSPQEVGGQIAAINQTRKGENRGIIADAAANVIDSVIGDYTADDDFARQWAAMQALNSEDGHIPSSGAFNAMNGAQRRAQQREQWRRGGK